VKDFAVELAKEAGQVLMDHWPAPRGVVGSSQGVEMDGSGLRKALLQERMGDRVRCLTCERRCLLKDGALGWCRTRKNQGGTLYTLIYGLVSSLSANPIEKKPVYHLYPGSVALTAGSWSCNFKCPWCQNWDISKRPPSGGRYLSAEEFVAQAVARGCQGISISFNEPTLSLEWSLDIFPLAREKGLYNTYVTNGYMTSEALHLLVEAGLDAMNVDIKGNAGAVKRYCAADVEKVWRNCRAAREAGVWVEITTLVIPTMNDDEGTLRSIARRISAELGPETPWHVSGYYPAYKFTAPSTSVRTLERAHDIGVEEGLDFVYVGNVLGHRYENTYCPDCGELLIQRFGLRVAQNRLDGARCPACQRLIPVVGI
jgi:pyruvate formate lyase activating enzyme